jgi:hypothetical protein
VLNHQFIGDSVSVPTIFNAFCTDETLQGTVLPSIVWDYVVMELQLGSLSNEVRGLSNAELTLVVERALAIEGDLRAAKIWASARGAEAERMLRAARREQERRNALAGRAVCWDVLLQAFPTTDDFMGGMTAEALAPFDLYLHENRVFTHTGQYVLALRMIQDEPDQVERVAQGLESVGRYVEPLRGNEWDVAVEHLGWRPRSRLRLYLTIRQAGAAVLNDALFPDVRAALRSIQQSHFGCQTRPGEPK